MPFDRCVGFFAWSNWGGVRTVLQVTTDFPHDVLLLRLVAALPTTRIQNSWSSKSLVKEGVTCYLCCMSYYCRSTTSSTPYYLLKPWTWVNKTIYWAVFSSWGRTAIFCGERLHLYAPAPFPCITYDPSSPWISSRMFLYRPEHHSYSNSHVV